MKFFGPLRKSSFLSRPNRFTLLCELQGRKVKAFLPNPGRLQELLLPGVVVHLETSSVPTRTLPYTAVAVEREGHPVMLHTHRTNDVASHLIENRAVPALRGFDVARTEVKMGNSRFDFFLKKGRQEVLLEVKSCTLFSRKVAMFPDAVTARGKKHLEELARLSSTRTLAVVLFLIHWPNAEVFMPDFHTDLEFARTFLAVKNRVAFIPLAVRWRQDLSLHASETRQVDLLWEAMEKEAHDRGSYLILYHLPRKRVIEPGGLGQVSFKPGYYVYVGSAMRNLSQRVERHRRMSRQRHWHIDYFSPFGEFQAALPIRSSEDLECELASAIGSLSEWSVPGFGCSDCRCPSHLFGFSTDPMSTRQFHKVLHYYRMDRLLEKYPVSP